MGGLAQFWGDAIAIDVVGFARRQHGRDAVALGGDGGAQVVPDRAQEGGPDINSVRTRHDGPADLHLAGLILV